MKVKFRRAAVASAVLSLAVLASACSSGTTANSGSLKAAAAATKGALKCDETLSTDQMIKFPVPQAKKPYKLTLMLISLAGYYYQGEAYGAQQAAKEAGVSLDIIASQGFSTAAQQVTQAQNVLTKGTDGIVLGPVDVNGSVPVVTSAAAQHVPVVAVGTFVNTTQTAAQVVQDDYMQGHAAAKAVADALPNGGEGIVQGGPSNATWSTARVQGFKDEIAQNYSKIKINAVTNENVDSNEGLTQFNNATASHPKVDWIYSAYNLLLPPSAVPAQYKNAVYVAGGLEPTTRPAVAAGKATVIPDWPIAMGRIGVAKVIATLNGEKLPALSCVGSPVVTPKDVNSPVAQAQVIPDGFKVTQ